MLSFVFSRSIEPKHKNRIKQNNKHLDLARKMKKLWNMSDSDNNCRRCPGNDPDEIEKELWRNRRSDEESRQFSYSTQIVLTVWKILGDFLIFRLN